MFFDFAVQLLEPDRITYWGRRRTPTFWTENASVRWKGSQAPFRVIGRLTLAADSVLPPDVAATMWMDVSTNCAPECKPIGGMDRAGIRRFREPSRATRRRRAGARPCSPHRGADLTRLVPKRFAARMDRFSALPRVTRARGRARPEHLTEGRSTDAGGTRVARVTGFWRSANDRKRFDDP